MSSKPFSAVTCGPDTYAKNEAVRDALFGYGDDGSETRPVLHFFYPSAAISDPSAMITSLKAYGYEVKAAQHQGLIAEHNSEVSSRDFDRETQGLDDLARKLGWSYDGWECEVVGE